ncbi:MAG: hypothetical protein NVSMB32_14470 [Actinomycetota bacterium]
MAAAFGRGLLPHKPRAAQVAAHPSPSVEAAHPLPPPTTPPGIPIPVSSTVATADINVVVAHKAPDAKSAIVANIPHHNLIGQETPFLVVATQPGWYQVLLPIRPNGTTGWISSDMLRISQTSDFLLATLSAYRIDHFVGGRLTESFPTAIGAPATPTPTGLYYLWAIQPDPGPPYDPVIFALSAFSPTLINWPEGGIVGIHGWADPSVEGKAVSSGCLRMHPGDAAHLQTELQLGVPIQIVP